MFQVGDYVYYASGGVCRVADVCYAPLVGMPKEKQYYVLHSLHASNSVMYVPVNSETVFLRELLTKEQAMDLLDQIREITEIEEPNAKLLKVKYAEAMGKHDPVEWVRVMKTVHARVHHPARQTKAQRISDTERSFAEDARRYLYTELSLILGVPVGEMDGYIKRHVESMV